MDGFVPNLITAMTRKADFVSIQTDRVDHWQIKPRTTMANTQATVLSMVHTGLQVLVVHNVEYWQFK